MSRVAVCSAWTAALIALFLSHGHTPLTATDDKKPVVLKDAPSPFVKLGATYDLHWGVPGAQSDPGRCTTLTLARVKELHVGLLMVKEGEVTVVEERPYSWLVELPSSKDEIPSIKGLVQVRYHKQGAKRYVLSFGAGFEGAGFEHKEKPKEVFLENTPSEIQFKGPSLAPGETHLVWIQVVHGGDKRIELDQIKSLEELKRASKELKRTTYLVTTLRWAAWK